MKEYQKFDLFIKKTEEQTYLVMVDNGHIKATDKITLPFSIDEIGQNILDVKSSLRSLRNASVEDESLTENLEAESSIRQVGIKLYQTLFNACIGKVYKSTVGTSRLNSRIEGVRISLRFDGNVSKLAQLPWELMFDESLDDYIAFYKTTPIVRFVELDQSIQPLPVEPPLRILGMVANHDLVI